MKNKRIIINIVLLILVVIIGIISFKDAYDFYSYQRLTFSNYSYRNAYIKGINSSPFYLSRRFFNIQADYRELLEGYLNNTLDFEAFDKELMEVGLPVLSSFRPYDDGTNKSKESKYYIRHSKLDSKYLFLRNNLSVARLDSNDIKVLITSNNEEKTNMLLSTYLQVIKKFETDEEVYVAYWYPPYKVEDISNDCLVLYIWCPYEINGKRLNEDTIKKINRITLKYDKIFSEQLGSRVKIVNINYIYYYDEGIIK